MSLEDEYVVCSSCKKVESIVTTFKKIILKLYTKKKKFSKK